MRTSAPYPCGCVVERDDNGGVHDVIRCQQHRSIKDQNRLMSILNVHPVLDVQITEPIVVRDRTGR